MSGNMTVTEFTSRLGLTNPEAFRKGMREAAKNNRPFLWDTPIIPGGNGDT